MWWNCDLQVYRTTILRLKVWARSEPEARGKIERMYLSATIQNLSPAGKGFAGKPAGPLADLGGPALSSLS